MAKIKENSPFTPGTPVPLELFVGRSQQIQEILKYIEQAASGKQENVFLAGERGIGKSSLASFVAKLASTKYNFITVHIFLGGVDTLEELVRRIFDQILNMSAEQTWHGKIKKFFKNYIRQVDLFGVTISFDPPKEDLKALVRHFPNALKAIIDETKDTKKGIFIALDDINGISKKPEFAHWYKSLTDSAAVTFQGDFPVFLMPIGLPEIRDILSEHQPSLMRIFRVVNIDKLSDKEVEEFFNRAFSKVKMEVLPEAMNIMVQYSSGLPILMHEIGDAVFWQDSDGIVSEDDAMIGVINAADRIGKKYLDPKVYRTIRSERYKSILRKLLDVPMSSFRRKEIEKKLNEQEKKVFNNFLRKMRELGIIIPDVEKGKGSYKFTNELYPVYIWMESLQWKKKAKTKNKTKEDLGEAQSP